MYKSSERRFFVSPMTGAVRFTAIVAVLAVILAGCAAIQNQQAIETERLLAAAGFQMRFADTPEKLRHLKTLTQRKLTPHQRDDKVYYVYADATSCECLYVGTEKAYQRYQNLALQKEIAEEQRVAAQMNEDAAMDWGMWGPWGPWY
jgi:hypothetical protein